MNPITETSSEVGSSMQSAVRREGNSSHKDLNRLVAESRDYVSKLAYKLAEVTTNILSTSKGRNKICSLIQYHAKLIYTSTINSNIPEVKEMLMYATILLGIMEGSLLKSCSAAGSTLRCLNTEKYLICSSS